MENGSNVDAIYLDFSKAFDKVDHKILLFELQKIGIDSKTVKWIESFVTGRVQLVIVEGVKSSPSKVISGVPQGSVLGPLLFLLMIGDIDSQFQYAIFSSFADDTRLLKIIQSPMDTFKLQSDKIYKWTKDNHMELNAAKYATGKTTI